MALLSVCHFNQILGKKQILKDISFQAQAGQVVAMLGPNGAGKTTLLKSIMGLWPAPAPDLITNRNLIMFDQDIINSWPVYKRVESGLLYLPQHTSLFQQLSVQDNLSVVYYYHDYWKTQLLETFQQEVNEWLEKTNLAHTVKQKAETLSGGQKRKLEIIRSLLMRPKMLLLDEPFAGVDPKSIYEIKNIFTDLAQTGLGIVISDHHVDQLLSIAQNVYVVVGGQVVASGSTKEILENSFTQESYLGKQFYEEMTQRYR